MAEYNQESWSNMVKILYVVIPCYNEEEVICETARQLEIKMKDLMKKKKISSKSKVMFVNDGSKDSTWEKILELHQKNKLFTGLCLSKNKGHQNALLAGLLTAKNHADIVISMDADLQDPPSLLRKMYDLIKNEGYDCIGTRRVTRKGEPPIRSFFARMFYKIINKMSNVEMVDGARDYRLMTKQMVKAIISMKEYNRYSKGLFSFVGFNTKWIEYENVERVAGETKWSFWKLFKYAIEGITAFSTTPLIISSVIGLLFCIISFLLIVVIIIKTLVFGDPTSGWPSMVCIMFFVSGVQLFSLGIIGQYLSKTYLEVKHRPIYIIKETEKGENDDK